MSTVLRLPIGQPKLNIAFEFICRGAQLIGFIRPVGEPIREVIQSANRVEEVGGLIVSVAHGFSLNVSPHLSQPRPVPTGGRK